MKQILLIILIFAVTISLIACSDIVTDIANTDIQNDTEETEIAEETETDDSLSVCFLASDLDQKYTSDCVSFFENSAKDNNISVTVKDAGNVAGTQVLQAEEMFYEDFDMYILNPVNSESLMNITDMADEAGHPLVISGYFSGTDKNFAEVAYNYDDIIHAVFEYIDSKYGGGRVFFAHSSSDAFSSDKYEETVQHAYSDFEGNIEIIAFADNENYSDLENSTLSLYITEDLDDFNIIIADGSFPAADIKNQATGCGREDIKIIAVGDAALLSDVENGIINAVAVVSPQKQAEALIDICLKYFNGEEINERIVKLDCNITDSSK